jgi:uncharacterized protein
MYESSIPYLIHGLKSLSGVLKKAEAHCAARNIDPSALLSYRLYPDMLPLIRQVLIACDFAKGCGARLSGHPVPSYTDDEKTFADLQARIAKTIDFVSGINKSEFADAAKRNVTIKVAGQEMSMPGHDYFHGFVLPNFYFHMTTAYNILRHNGVELGKGDFMGRG